MDEVNNMEALKDTNEQGNQSAEQAEIEQPEGATQPEGEQNDGQGSENSEATEDAAFLPIRYNHEDMNLTRSEAVKYAQMGKLLSDSGLDISAVKPIYSKLDYFAATQGMSPEELIDNLISRDEERHHQELVEKFGEDGEELEILMQAYRERQKDKYDKILKDRIESEQRAETEKIESNNSRLANEFIELKKEFPELTDITSVPEQVKRMAVTGNKDLLSCFLLFKHNEEKAIAAANKTAEDAKKAGTGSGASAGFTTDNAFDAFLRGFNS